jgi:mevalonate kinase
MENMKKKTFSAMMRDEFIKCSDACVEDFLQGNLSSLFKNMKSLSALVLKNFEPMIPMKFHKLWQKGIETNDYYLKLCGSGGGGFILGFAKDFEKAKKALKDYSLEVVYHF